MSAWPERPFATLAGVCDGAEALARIQQHLPDIIFLDIQMPDITGFEVIEKLTKKPNIIFTTAYEQYAIKAFETFSIDYLLKPIKEERLEQSIKKLKLDTQKELKHFIVVILHSF